MTPGGYTQTVWCSTLRSRWRATAELRRLIA